MDLSSKKYDIIVVGAGLSGAVIAERYANVLNKKVLVLEKRGHIGGNCYDFVNRDGILVPLYGGHIFHTNDEGVWNYVNRFSEWRNYEHRVKSFVDGRIVPISVNAETINIIFNTDLKSESDIIKWFERNTEKIRNPKNSEEAALARVGRVLYEKMFKNYTYKQWGMHPKELAPSVMNRIPVHTNFDDRYFTDKYQAMPRLGYTEMFRNMLRNENIDIQLNTDWFSVKNLIIGYEKLFFTGEIDKFFEYKLGDKLQYRSLRFEFETIDKEYYSRYATINYPNDYKFMRIVEPKHITGQKHNKTTIIRDYPVDSGEPYYPVPTERNIRVYLEYKREADKLEKNGVYFAGRLANYKYFNMDQAIRNALDLFSRVENDRSY